MSALSTGGGIATNIVSPSPWGALAVPGIMMSGKGSGGGYKPQYQIGPNGQYQFSQDSGKSWDNVPQGWATAPSLNGQTASMTRVGALGSRMTMPGTQQQPLSWLNPTPLPDVQAANHMDTNIRGFQGFLGNNPGGSYAGRSPLASSLPNTMSINYNPNPILAQQIANAPR